MADTQAIQNTQDGNNLLAVADGSYSNIESNLQTIRSLAVQAANDTNGSSQRTAIVGEINARVKDINQIASSTQFNGTNLLKGTISSFRIQVGANSGQALNTINIASGLGSTTATSLGLGTVNLSTNSKALTFLATVDTALNKVNSFRAAIGSNQNRLTDISNNLSIAVQNFSASRSSIEDVDVASATSQLSQEQVLQQASASILAQANQAPDIALKLITG